MTAKRIADIRVAALAQLKGDADQLEHMQSNDIIDRRSRLMRVGIGTTIVIALSGWLLHDNIGLLVAVLLVITWGAAFVYFLLADDRHFDAPGQIRDRILDAVCAVVGHLSYTHSADGFDLAPFRATYLIRSATDIDDTDQAQVLRDAHIAGVHRGFQFEAAGTRVYQGAGKHRMIDFDGVLLKVLCPRQTTDRVSVLKNHGALSHGIAAPFIDMPRITFGDAAFSAQYAVYADHAADAGALISPGVVHALQRMKTLAGHADIMIAWHNTELLLAIEKSQPFLSASTPNGRAFDLDKTIVAAVETVTLLHRIIDALATADGPLPSQQT
ncbi:MAG: DUF3137 domain-containing protein [Pseudomonadota bacterium]